jgi:hypothetical protein
VHANGAFAGATIDRCSEFAAAERAPDMGVSEGWVIQKEDGRWRNGCLGSSGGGGGNIWKCRMESTGGV